MITTTKNTPNETFAAEPSRFRKLPKDVAMQAIGQLGAGINALFGSRAGDRLGILTYHRIADHVPRLPAPLHNVTPRRFREQLSGLVNRGYRFWQLRDAIAHHGKGKPFPNKSVVVTFDDGFQSVYTDALSTLLELKIPATIFLNTAYLDSDEPFPFDAWGVPFHTDAPQSSYRPLTTEQCHEMADSGLIEFGAHTHTHGDFRGRAVAFRKDLQTSVDIVREKFDLDEVTFAFPYGGRHNGFASDELARQAKRTGVTCGLTTEPVLVDRDDSPFQWGRFNAFPWDTSRTLAAKLSGWYSWAPKLNQRIARFVRGN